MSRHVDLGYTAFGQFEIFPFSFLQHLQMAF